MNTHPWLIQLYSEGGGAGWGLVGEFVLSVKKVACTCSKTWQALQVRQKRLPMLGKEAAK